MSYCICVNDGNPEAYNEAWREAIIQSLFEFTFYEEMKEYQPKMLLGGNSYGHSTPCLPNSDAQSSGNAYLKHTKSGKRSRQIASRYGLPT